MSLKHARRREAFIVAVIACAIALLGLAQSASAASPSLPDPSRTGSINIHKFQAPDTPTGLPANGTAVNTAGLTPVPGVTFSIQQVNTLDLTINQGWQDANTLSGAFDPNNAAASITAAGYTLGTASSRTTNASGDASFTTLPLGLYLVTETSWPSGTTPSAPFLITVPLTDPTNQSSWLYDVNVYPKNSVDTISKSVTDANAVKLGDPVTWTIKGDIPNVSTIDGYQITDQLDPKLTYSTATVTLSDGTTITQGSDYTIAFDTASNTLTVQFTAAGRGVLAAHSAAQVVVTVNTTVNMVGEITNTALLYPNANSFTIAPGQPGGPTPSNPVTTKWGSITIQKTDPAGGTLAGAVFSVYPTQADAQAGTNPITINGVSTFTTDATGQVTISGLRYSDWATGAAVAPGDPGYRDYYLGEVTAPTGYELLAQPIKFAVTATTTTIGVDLTVKDVPANAGFQLPFTGGHGLLFYYIGGAVLLGLALVLGMTRRRHSAA